MQLAEILESNNVRIGVDIGLTGAICLLYGAKVISLHDMPIKDRTVGKGKEIDATALYKELSSIMATAGLLARDGDVICNVEYVSGQSFTGRRVGGTSMFNFGDSLGVVRGVLASFGIVPNMIKPMVWRKRFNLVGRGKDVSRLLCIEYFGLDHELRFKKHNGRSDAILIALSK